jgi:large subunit ribosomal protein L9
MDIILLERIPNLGRLGDKVSVKSGYWRNYLHPRKKAVLATAENMAAFEAQRAELEKAVAEKVGEAQARADKLQEVHLTITAKASEEGKLYGSLGQRDIAEAIEKATQVVIDKNEIHLASPIRMLGDYDIEVRLHPDVVATIKLSVVVEKEAA